MSPSCLFLLTLSLGLAAPATNYDLVKTIIVNYMTAFEGSQFNSTAQCFDPVTTSKLDGDIVSLMKALVFGKVEDLEALGKVFVTDLELALWNCQVEDIRAAFVYNVQTRGYGYIVGNVFWRAPDIYKLSLKGLGDALVFDYGGMATNFGAANKLVSPPKPVNAVQLTGDMHAPFNSQDFLSGLAQGLEASPNGADQCTQGLTSLPTLYSALVSDLKEVIAGNPAAIFQLLADYKSLDSALTSDSSACNLPALRLVLASLATPEGLAKVSSNVKANLGAIETASASLLSCEQDPYQCGFSAGEVLRLALGWSL